MMPAYMFKAYNNTVVTQTKNWRNLLSKFYDNYVLTSNYDVNT